MSAQKGAKPQQQKKETPVVTYVGMVKAVNSGDSVLVYNQQGKEKEIFFSNIKAPRYSRNDQQAGEDWAYEAREFLRKLCIGQQVSFTIEHKTEQGREYGTVSMGSVNLTREVVANGWATVSLPPEGKRARNEFHEGLITLFRRAEDDQIGIFQKKEAPKKLPKPSNDQSKLFEEIKGNHTAVVEYIRDGTTFRVTLPNLQRIYLKISGAEAPNIPNPKNEAVAPAFAVEARNFVEKNLLHRDVSISVRSPGDKDGEFYGTISFKGRDVAEEMIKQGYAKFVAWNAPPQNKELLQNLESDAKQKKLRIWKSFDASSNNNNNNNNNNNSKAKSEVIGKLNEIRDGANFTIVDTSVTPSRRVPVTLSSIQVPKFGNPNTADEAYGYEAKEYVRKNFIGKKVRAEVDFVRPAVKGVAGKPDLPEKEFWSVYCGDINIAVALVENGLAKVTKSKDGRSISFEDLIIAEKSAQSANKNLWNKNKSAPVHTFSDLTLQTKESKQRAKQFLPFFQRTPHAKVTAVVEFVLSPSRVKVFIPKENCMIVLGLEGIKTPKSSPFYNEALEYVRDKIQHRDVQVIVETLDKVGSFIGSLFIQKKNFGVTLLEAGYASISENVDYSLYAKDLQDAEVRAKEAKKKIWQNYSGEAAQQPKSSSSESSSENIIEVEKKPKLMNVTISEIVDASNFYIHLNEEKEALDNLMNELNNQNIGLAPVNYAPKKGEFCIAKFSDKKWYRAKILNANASSYSIFYIDYGNEDTVQLKDMRPIPSQFLKSDRPPFAKQCYLAYVSLPTDGEYAEEAVDYFHQMLWGKQLYATIEYVESEKVYVAIGDGKILANIELAAVGFAVLNKDIHVRRNKNPLLISKIREEMEIARSKHYGRWEYGDFENDDE